MGLRRERYPGIGLTVGLAVLALLAAPAGWGIKTSDDTTIVYGGQLTSWDSDAADSSCGLLGDGGFSPAEDVAWHDDNDAFDGGLMVSVGTVPFTDADGILALGSSNSYKAAGTADGLRVTESVRALQGSPTLRVLVNFRNSSGSGVTRPIGLTSDFGGSEVDVDVRATSSGDSTFLKTDRWIVTSTDPTSPPEPPVAHVFYGKGAANSLDAVSQNPSGNDCMAVSFVITVPAHASRNLMFFTEVHAPGSNGPAISSAAKFNRRGLSGKLLKGIGHGTRRHIVNWDLG